MSATAEEGGSRLAGKVGLITGGSSGFGRDAALALAARGAHLVIADVDQEAGERTASEVGGRFVRTDVSVPEESIGAVEFASGVFEGLDFAFLNAGVTTGCGMGDDFDLERYRNAMSVNLDGVVFGVNAALPALRESRGSILVTASLAGLAGVPFDPIYAANKHAVVGLVRSLGPALAGDGVKVNAVCPGYADTPLVAPFREALLEAGMPLIPVERVTEAVVAILESDDTGECWFVQAGREPGRFRFRGVPGPR